MHQKIIMVVAADLKREGDRVSVGPETALVCAEAAAIAANYQDAIVYATAGWSSRYGVTMGEGPMRDALLDRFVEAHRIRTPVAWTFNTDGEMRALVKDVPWKRIPELEILLVCRSWHLPRAWCLLRGHLSLENRRKTHITSIRVKGSTDVKGMLLEPLAWLKNLPRILNAI